MAMGAGLRPKAKGLDEPPDPTVRAPVLDPTERRTEASTSVRLLRPDTWEAAEQRRARVACGGGGGKAVDQGEHEVGGRVPDSYTSPLMLSGS